MLERILTNCCVLPIETDGQDTALRIFSTMNDRGKPLSDSDIFKAKLYKAYSNTGQKEWFIQNCKEFEDTCENIFVSDKTNPIDNIFMRYMHYTRASQKVSNTLRLKASEIFMDVMTKNFTTQERLCKNFRESDFSC